MERSPINLSDTNGLFLFVKSVYVLCALLFVLMFCAPLQMILLKTHKPSAKRLPMRFHGFLLALLGVKKRIIGAPNISKNGQMTVSNHVSWSDILVLGASTTGCFVSKAEVAHWPIIGALSKLQRTVFVERARKTDTKKQVGDIAKNLNNNENVFLFPEGTSYDGNKILPFKSSLFGVTDKSDKAYAVQPVFLSYDHINGVPAGRGEKSYAAWYGDMNLGPHLKNFISLFSMRVSVFFAPAVKSSDFASRKDLTKYCEERIKFLQREMRDRRKTPPYRFTPSPFLNIPA